ncbi:lectin [Naegleria gruberi]|uniref:Lectin n=1 Tax=Naegleria gruberi TaxID=5762 RepID=D2VNU9_NAEGR|nr:lectin [Naegleria gruberi]EFC41479.1 lectin [Naegleria gruberi]|eukprot:XP_002674223.1 lectin [Naegleria gruberi]
MRANSRFVFALLLVLFLVPFILESIDQTASSLLTKSNSNINRYESTSISSSSIFVEAQRRRRRLNKILKKKKRYEEEEDDDDDEDDDNQQQQQQPPQQVDQDDESSGDNDSSNDKVVMEKHTFRPPFLFGGQQSVPHWEYGGSSIATESYIRVVPNIKSRTGYLWNLEPVHMKSWQVEFDIHIHNNHNPGADGMAFWYAKEPFKTGTLMGYTDSFEGLGILFDTYDNNMDGDNPAVIAISGNGQHVNYDVDHDFKANQLDRCRADIRNPSAGKTSVRVTYQNSMLGVYLDTANSGSFVKCFELNNIHLKEGFYFGLTAATGGLADNHDALNFITYDLNPAPVSNEGIQPPSHHHRGWYDPYEEFQKYLDKQKQDEEAMNHGKPAEHHQQQQQVNLQHEVHSEIERKKKETEQAWEEEQKIFNQLKEKMKHVDESQDASSKDQPPVQHHEGGHVTFNMQTGLLILEALEEVTRTIKKSSTKSDIINILEFVNEVSKKQEEVQAKFTEFSENTKRDVSGTLQELKRDTDTLNVQLRKLDSLITNIYNDVNNIQRSHGEIHSGISKQTESLGEMQRFGNGWLLVIFILFQVVFTVGFIYYRKFQESKSKFY